MIDWNASAELNGCTVGYLKSRFEKFPYSNKKIVRICNNCHKKRKVEFAEHSELCYLCTMATQKYRNSQSKKAIKSHNKEKDPIPDDQKIAIPENKNCAQYLGSIAEEILASTYKNVKRMPHSNPGFDFICNQNFKIDVKSSAIGYKNNGWSFDIRKNIIADYFLCIAFESRKDITPIYLWLIPGYVVNHLTSLAIRKSTIQKWYKYEQPLDKAILCCDEMKEYNYEN